MRKRRKHICDETAASVATSEHGDVPFMGHILPVICAQDMSASNVVESIGHSTLSRFEDRDVSVCQCTHVTQSYNIY